MVFCHIFPKELPLEPESGFPLPGHFLDTLSFVNINAFKSLPCYFPSALCTSVMLWVLSFNPILCAGSFHWADVRVSWLFGCSCHRHQLCVWQVVVASDANCRVHQCSISPTVQVLRVLVSSCLATISCLGFFCLFLLVHRSNL